MSQDAALETRVSEQEREIARLQREVATLRRNVESARQSAVRYRAMFDSLDAGFCVIQMIFADDGRPVDYRFVDVNLAFERQTGLVNPVGKTMRSFAPDHEEHWFQIYGEVALTGQPKRFENPATMLGRYYDVYAFRTGEPEERKVGVLFSDISLRKQAEAAWREASSMKDRFLATLAHELRNPLAPLQSGIEVLRDHDARAAGDQAAEDRVLDIMGRQLGHLRHLMDELLDVSRINRGMLALNKERFDLVSAIRKGVDFVSATMHSGHRDFTVDLPREPLPVQGDRDRLAQVVAALLDNAAKFTSEGGRIRLRAVRHGRSARLCVEDDGLGIDPHMLEKIFDMFSQGSTDRQGLGIGLTVVRNLVELHGGTVTAHSRGRGTGSRFVVELPLCLDERAEPHDGRRRPDLPPLERQRMLVVDDNRDAADSLSVLLSSMGGEVRTAYDGQTALLMLDELQPQIVFLDIGMPGMNGYEVARRVRQRQGGGDIMLVAVTGWGQPADRQRAKDAGFDNHLVKPATFDDLRQIVGARSSRSDTLRSADPS